MDVNGRVMANGVVMNPGFGIGVKLNDIGTIRVNQAFTHYDEIIWEIVSEFENEIDSSFLPIRATRGSAGFDLKAARDTVVPSIFTLLRDIENNIDEINDFVGKPPYTLEGIDKILKMYGARATIVPTGLKCKMPNILRCSLYSRSSIPYKHLLIIANGVGTIDADYYNNKDNEGHIGVMLINLSPFDILIKKGDKIAQAIFEPYIIGHYDETESEVRVGGYGSTGK